MVKEKETLATIKNEHSAVSQKEQIDQEGFIVKDIISKVSNHNKQLKFLSESAFLEESYGVYFFRTLIWILVGAFFISIIYLFFFKVDVTIKAEGVVIPNGLVRTIRPNYGGVIVDIFVKEGQTVKKGDKLFQLKSMNPLQDLTKLKKKQVLLKLKEENFKSFLEDRTPDFFIVTEQYEDLILNNFYLHDALLVKKQNELMLLEKKLSNKLQDLENLQEQKSLINTSLKLRKTKTKNSTIQKNLNEKSIININNKIINDEVIISNLKKSIDSFEERFKAEMFHRLEDVQNEIKDNSAIIMNQVKQIESKDIIAPVDGIVRHLQVDKIGDIVEQKRYMMDIIPINKKNIAEVKLSNEEISHIKIGQQVLIKLDIYNFLQYGTITGIVDDISQNMFVSNNGKIYYKVYIMLEKNHVGVDTGNIILPGMSFVSNILITQKNIVSYLLGKLI